jgi:hypothetical protein
MAVLEIGDTAAVPIVSAAAASALASNIFMAVLLSHRRRSRRSFLNRDRPCPLVLV